MYLCLVVFVETSSSLRQASSSWARVLGGGRGGMAGSWINGWAGWWLRRWPQLPPPPHVCVWAEELPKDFLVLWLLQGRKKTKQCALRTCNGETKSRTFWTKIKLLNCCYLWDLCLPCRLLSKIHCNTFWVGSVVSLGSCRGPQSSIHLSATPSSAPERHTRLDRELDRLQGRDRDN